MSNALKRLLDLMPKAPEFVGTITHEDHPKYKECGDQFLRNFLNGLIIHKRGVMPRKNESDSKTDHAK